MESQTMVLNSSGVFETAKSVKSTEQQENPTKIVNKLKK